MYAFNVFFTKHYTLTVSMGPKASLMLGIYNYRGLVLSVWSLVSLENPPHQVPYSPDWPHTYCAAEDSELLILPAQSPECQDYRHAQSLTPRRDFTPQFTQS